MSKINWTLLLVKSKSKWQEVEVYRSKHYKQNLQICFVLYFLIYYLFLRLLLFFSTTVFRCLYLFPHAFFYFNIFLCLLSCMGYLSFQLVLSLYYFINPSGIFPFLFSDLFCPILFPFPLSVFHCVVWRKRKNSKYSYKKE